MWGPPCMLWVCDWSKRGWRLLCLSSKTSENKTENCILPHKEGGIIFKALSDNTTGSNVIPICIKEFSQYLIHMNEGLKHSVSIYWYKHILHCVGPVFLFWLYTKPKSTNTAAPQRVETMIKVKVSQCELSWIIRACVCVQGHTSRC